MKTSTLKTVLAVTTWAGVALLTQAVAAPLSDAKPVTIEAAGGADHAAILADEGFGPQAIAALVETARHESPVSGKTFVTYEQRVLGTPVHDSYLRVVLGANGEVEQLTHRLARLRDLRTQLPAVADARALGAAVGRVFGRAAPAVQTSDARRTVFDAGDFYAENPSAELVLLADEDGTVSPGYLVRAWSKSDNRLVHSVVTQDGRTLRTEERTSNDSYIAYAVSPKYGNATVMQGSQANRTASPNGWLDTAKAQYTDRITGNNVAAYVDRNADDAADTGGARVTNGVFGTVPNLGLDATAAQNRRAAVQNVFYHINVIHDRLYKHGFTETAGNFQADNFGRGGRGGDYVRAEVLDGSGNNNANFSTPMYVGGLTGDGGAPRMQMYKWTFTNPERAGSFDADIIWHEYGHGVIWRMVGGMDTPIAWAVNEGFADGLAVIATGNDAVGEWAANRTSGIRSSRYANYPKRLSDYRPGRSNAHRNGELYGAAMWELREEFRRAGRSDDQAMDLVIEGLNHTQPGPTFLDMRDGLLAAGDSNEDCRVWRAFAKLGMGEGARMSWSGSASSPNVSVSASTRVPSSCGSTSASAPSPAPAPAPSPAPSSSSTDVKCADERGSCTVPSNTTVRYGANGQFVTKTMSGTFSCTSQAFGRDPIPGVRKACYTTALATTASGKCADERGTCTVPSGTSVRYGANGQYVTKTMSGTFSCTSQTFGRDPIPGVRKACYVPTTSTADAKCADERGSCTVPSNTTVRYGANGQFVTKTMSGTFSCTSQAFGRDPIPGVRKACYTTALATTASGKCADERGTCTVPSGTSVRYGANGQYVTKTMSGTFSCTSQVFGRDPIVGVRKACYVN